MKREVSLTYATERQLAIRVIYVLDVINFDFQHELALGKHHMLIWGVDFRYHHDEFDDTPLLKMSPDQRDYSLYSAFVQDRISIAEDHIEVTFGSKFEYYTVTGWEIQPTARILWKLSPKNRT